MAVGTRRTGRCLLYVAAAGYGKTAALEALALERPSVYRSADALADLTDSGTLLDQPTEHVILDDLCRLTPPAQRRLAQTLTGLPAHLRITLASRQPLEESVRQALPGPVVEWTAADLALPRDALTAVLRDEHGLVDIELAGLVYELTAGWPALVQYAGTALAEHGIAPRDLLAALTEPGTPCSSWIRDQVLPEVPAHTVDLLGLAAELDPLPEQLCLELAAAKAPAAHSTVDALRWLVETGLFVVQPRSGSINEKVFRLVPAIAAVVAQRPRTPGASMMDVPGARDATVRWYLGNSYPLSAAALLRGSGQHDRAIAVFEAYGDEILAAGRASELAEGIRAVPEPERSTHLRLLLGDALRMSGDPAAAHRVFEPLLDVARRDGHGDPGLLWRAAMVHYMRADYAAALAICDLAVAPASGTIDDALLLSCRASVLTMLGHTEDAMRTAVEALSAARDAGNDRAIAAANIAAALTAVGVRREEYLAIALAAAERANDIVQVTRILLNQSEGLIRQARYPDAWRIAARAVRTAELGCPPGMLIAALSNAGDALLQLGRGEEAALHFERVVQISQRTGIGRAAIGLWGLGEVHRQHGRRERSRAAFEEAADLARAAADPQVLVPALAGLARVLLDGPGADIAAARAAADEAVRLAHPVLAARALTASGWVALAEGDPATARRHASAAVAAARETRRPDSLADALELTAALAPSTVEARAALGECEEIWRRSGAAPMADRIQVLLGQLPGTGSAQRLEAKAAARRLLALGMRVPDGSNLLPTDGTATAPVRIRVLGTFEVFVGGQPVPLPAWRSRQARSLVKILVGYRGRTVPRLQLRELLWPDEAAHKTAHRLSVLLSVIRTVLDPGRLWPTDHYIRADQNGISLDIDHVSVDVEELLRDAAHAAALLRHNEPVSGGSGETVSRVGEIEQAREVLAEVDRLYRGDAFGDEPYEDWADALREEARTAWLRALRDLAELSQAAGEPDQAIGYLVRLLAVDGFDENAHRVLVELLLSVGRHGEARRAFERWSRAMRAIDVPPPDAALLAGPAQFRMGVSAQM